MRPSRPQAKPRLNIPRLAGLVRGDAYRVPARSICQSVASAATQSPILPQIQISLYSFGPVLGFCIPEWHVHPLSSDHNNVRCAFSSQGETSRSTRKSPPSCLLRKDRPTTMYYMQYNHQTRFCIRWSSWKQATSDKCHSVKGRGAVEGGPD